MIHTSYQLNDFHHIYQLKSHKNRSWYYITPLDAAVMQACLGAFFHMQPQKLSDILQIEQWPELNGRYQLRFLQTRDGTNSKEDKQFIVTDNNTRLSSSIMVINC